MERRPGKPSATLLIAVVALIIGLEAPAMAHQVNVVAHRISGSKLKNNSVTGKQIKESTLHTVPRATLAAKLPALRWHALTPLNGWASGSVDTPAYRPPAYAVDAQGLVHLRGTLDGGNSGTIAFALPKALLPPSGITLGVPMLAAGGHAAQLIVTSDGGAPSAGTATAQDVSDLSVLDGISFAPR